MKIALVALHYAEYSLRLALALSKEHSVLLFLYADDAANELGRAPEDSPSDGGLKIVLIHRPKNIGQVFLNARRLVREVSLFRPDVVHYQEAFRDEIVVAWPFMPKTPTVLTIHDPSPHSGEDAWGLRWSRRRVYRYAFRRWTDHVITHGKYLTQELLRNNDGLVGKVSEVAHGVLGTGGDFCIDNATPSGRLLFFGRLYKYKGLARFVDAVIRLQAMGIDVVGVVAGRGPDLAPNLDRMMSSGCFEILDRFIAVEELPAVFSGARAVVLPYLDGTQSGVAAMAFGFGRPVVCTSVGSIPEVVHHGANGLVVNPSDDHALVDALRRILTDDLLWSELAAGARESAQGVLNWGNVARNTSQVYASLLQEPAEKAR